MTTTETPLVKTIPQNGNVKGQSRDYPVERVSERIGEFRSNDIKNEVKVFLVDDDKFFLTALYYFLTDSLSLKIKFKTFSTAEECLAALPERPDIVVLDYMLSTAPSAKVNGLSVLKKINEISPGTFVIMLSAQDNIDVALETINEGAYDYLSKSESAFIRLKNMIKNLAEAISEDIDQDRRDTITKRINISVIVFLLLLIIIGQLTH